MGTRTIALITACAVALLTASQAPALADRPFPACFVRSDVGSNSTEPGRVNEPGAGPVLLHAEGLYEDPRNAQIIDIEWHTENNSRLTNGRNLTGKNTIANVSVNGISQRWDSQEGAGKTTSPGYTVHGRIDRFWVDKAGRGHELTKGDVVTWSVNVTFIGATTNDSFSGNTQATCVV